MSVAPTTAAEGFPRRAFTIDDIGRMIDAGIIREDEKFELIEGEIVMMAAKGLAHERRQLVRQRADDCDGQGRFDPAF